MGAACSLESNQPSRNMYLAAWRDKADVPSHCKGSLRHAPPYDTNGPVVAATIARSNRNRVSAILSGGAEVDCAKSGWAI